MLTTLLYFSEGVIQSRQCSVQVSRLGLCCCEQCGAKRHRKSDALLVKESGCLRHALHSSFTVAGMPSRPTPCKRADGKPLRHRMFACQRKQRLGMLTRMRDIPTHHLKERPVAMCEGQSRDLLAIDGSLNGLLGALPGSTGFAKRPQRHREND